MVKSKKINPRKRPVTAADVERAKREMTGKVVKSTWAIFFMALYDKEGYSPDDLWRVWGEVRETLISIGEGYITPADLVDTLKRETGLVLE